MEVFNSVREYEFPHTLIDERKQQKYKKTFAFNGSMLYNFSIVRTLKRRKNMLTQFLMDIKPLAGIDQNTIMTFAPILLLIVVFYFLLIRPQKKREKSIQAMRSSLKVGDKLVTIGGIHGKVVKLNDDKLVIETNPDKTKIEITRWAVSSITNESKSDDEKPKKKSNSKETESDEE